MSDFFVLWRCLGCGTAPGQPKKILPVLAVSPPFFPSRLSSQLTPLCPRWAVRWYSSLGNPFSSDLLTACWGFLNAFLHAWSKLQLLPNDFFFLIARLPPSYPSTSTTWFHRFTVSSGIISLHKSFPFLKLHLIVFFLLFCMVCGWRCLLFCLHYHL